jgi:hypothetical protein
MQAVTGLNIGEYYDFTPVPIGKTIRILGASFEFDYRYSFFGESLLTHSLQFPHNPYH